MSSLNKINKMKKILEDDQVFKEAEEQLFQKVGVEEIKKLYTLNYSSIDSFQLKHEQTFYDPAMPKIKGNFEINHQFRPRVVNNINLDISSISPKS